MFFWDRFVGPMASLLETVNYTPEVQCQHIIYLYSRINGFLGPEDRREGQIAVCVDGSTGEPSWIMPDVQPQGCTTNGQGACAEFSFKKSGLGFAVILEGRCNKCQCTLLDCTRMKLTGPGWQVRVKVPDHYNRVVTTACQPSTRICPTDGQNWSGM